MAALFDFKGYDNEVLENKIESILSTKLDMNRFMTPDYSLEGEPGMVKIIHRYVGSGEAEDLARGDGNTQFIDAEFTPKEYRVSRTQAQTRYYDDDLMTDPVLIDTKVKTMAEAMVNDWTKKALAEFHKSTNSFTITDWSFGNFADAIAEYANETESEDGLFFVVGQEYVPAIRKELKDTLQYVEAYARTGYIGSICGVPLYFTKADLNGDKGYLATREAVTAFIKKDVRVEQGRDIDTKLNNIVADRYAVIALTDESKCVVLK